ncbi:MAG: AI-2E family transporter [Gammaproteobacteria bacterium]|nr:AI-2E family transporter [Gammaproteobacteria bacterium]
MWQYIKQWYTQYFSDPQAIILALVLLAVFAVIVVFGQIMVPVITAVVLAYILEGLVSRLESLKIPRLLAVVLVMLLFLATCFVAVFGIIPMLTRQLTRFFTELPEMLGKGQSYLELLPQRYPAVFSETQIRSFFEGISNELLSTGQQIVSVSLAKAVGVLTVLVYIVLVPILVFFGLKDKYRILAWFERFLPERRELTRRVWRDVDVRIGSYIRGKIIEILIVWLTCYVVFTWCDLNYSMLLSFLVGLSVIIPYVGAIVVTIPIAIIAYIQWGIGPDFWFVVGAYTLIQILDGNALVPVLFSEVVNLHPVAIIVSIVFFGGLWGVWGIFFAIPLATLIDTVIGVWPRRTTDQSGDPLSIAE